MTDDVSLDVPQGEALGIVGPNGAGKSTLFNRITGNLSPGAGRVQFLGRDVTRVPAMQRCLIGVGRILVADFGRVIGLGAPEAAIASKEVRGIYPGIEG